MKGTDCAIWLFSGNELDVFNKHKKGTVAGIEGRKELVGWRMRTFMVRR